MKRLLTICSAAVAAVGMPFTASAEDAYIASSGANTINTGYYASGKTKISVDFQMTEIKSGNDCLIGHYKAAGQFTLLIYCPGTTSIFAEAKDGAHAGTAKMFKAGSTTEYAGSDTARHTIVIDAPGRRSDMYAADGTPQAYYEFPGSWTYNSTSTWPLLLFAASNDADGTPLQPVKAKIYGVKIWETENGVTTLVHDYVPAIKGGYPGFYDTVTGDFFSNKPSTSAAFTYGGDVLELEDDTPYVESDGSFFSTVDTRYFPNNKTKVEVDFHETEIVSGDCVFGHYASDYTILLYRPNSSLYYWLVAKDGSYTGLNMSPAVNSDTRRHTAVVDIPNRHVEMRAPDGGVQGSADLSSKTDWSWNFNTVNNPLMLFGSSTSFYGGSQQRVKAKIFSAKFYENANADGSGEWTTKHIFLPCKKDGIVGFKDQITGKFVSGDNLTAGGNVPEETTTEPYIDTGTNGVAISLDTGYYVTKDTCVVCDYTPLKQRTSPQQFPFEAGDSVSATNGSDKSYMRAYGNGSTGQGDISYACGKTLFKSTSVPYKPNVRRKVTLDAYNGKVKVESNGEVLNEIALDAACRNPNPSSTTLKILSNGAGTGNYCMARLYSFQIYEAGVLVRDYRPCVKGGVVGLRDIEGDGGFITASNAANSLKLMGGGAIEGRTDAYIENDGVTALNLGYKANMKTRIEYDFQNLLLGADKVFFGAWNGDVGKLRYCCWNNGGKIKFIFGGNSSGTQNPTSIDTDCKRHTAIMDFKNKALAFVTDGTTNTVTVAGTFGESDTSTQNMGAFSGIAANGSTSMQSTSRIYAIRIYEDNVLVHEFLPYKNGDTVSLYDTKTGNVAAKLVSSSATPTISGKGVDGAEKWLVEPQGQKLTKKDATKDLWVNASGAVSYKWTKNGEEVSTDPTFTFTVTASEDYVAHFEGPDAIEESTIECQIFPNPFTSKVIIKTEKALRAVSVYDIYGRLLKEQKVSDMEIELDLGDLSNGAYLLKLDYGNSSSVHRVMKVRK